MVRVVRMKPHSIWEAHASGVKVQNRVHQRALQALRLTRGQRKDVLLDGKKRASSQRFPCLCVFGRREMSGIGLN
jgi:hypothetical protein